MKAFRPAKPCPITKPMADDVEYCLTPVMDWCELGPVSSAWRPVPDESKIPGTMKILRSLLAMCYLP